MVELNDISILKEIQQIVTEEYNNTKEFLPPNSQEIHCLASVANTFLTNIKNNTRQKTFDPNSVASYDFKIPSLEAEEPTDESLNKQVSEQMESAGKLSREFIHKWKSLSDNLKTERASDILLPSKPNIDEFKKHCNISIHAKNEMMKLISMIKDIKKHEIRAVESDRRMMLQMLNLLNH